MDKIVVNVKNGEQSIVPLTAEEIATLPTEPTQEVLFTQAIEAIRVGLQLAIDEKAKAYGFSGGNALMLYAGFNNPYQTLAQKFATWEANVWYEAGLYRDEVIGGAKSIPTIDEAIAMIPLYEGV